MKKNYSPHHKIMTDTTTIEKIDQLNDKSWEYALSDLDKSKACAMEAQELSVKQGYKRGFAYSSINLGWWHCDMSDYNKSLESFFTAKETFSEIGEDEGLLKAFAGISGVNFFLGEFDTTLKYNLLAIDIAKKINNIDRLRTAQLNTAQVYFELERYDEALEYSFKMIDLLDTHGGQTLQVVITYDLLGQVYFVKEQFEESEKWFWKAIDHAQQGGDTKGQEDAYCGLGKLYTKIERYDTAEEMFHKAISVSTRKTYDTYLSMAEFYVSVEKVDDGEKIIQDLLPDLLKFDEKPKIQTSYELLSKINALKENYKKAYEFTQEATKLDKVIHHEKTERKLFVLSFEHKIEDVKKENEIHQLKNIALKEKNDELEQKQKIISILQSIGQELTLTFDSHEIVNIVYSYLYELIDIDTFGLAYYYEKTEEIDYKLYIERGKDVTVPRHTLSNSTSFTAWCIKNREAIHLSDLESQYHEYVERPASAGEMYAQTLLFIPLTVESKVVGVLTIQNEKKEAYSEQDMYVINMIASYLAVAIENSRKHDEVTELTGQLAQEKKELQLANEKIQTLASETHKVGMADIARDILHNVGNIITSVLTSAQMVSQVSNDFPLSKMKKANKLIHVHEDDLEHFMHHDPKAKKLLLYYLELEKMFEKSQHTLNTHIERTLENIKLITDIVRRLEGHTTQSYTVECTGKEIIDEVLLMKQSELQKEQIIFTRNIHNESKIMVQRVKLVFVLISVLDNAIHAVEQNLGNKKIDILVSGDNSGNVIFTIKDNGIGLTKERCSTIFNQKSDGESQGMNLHYCANYMREMNGRITVASDGVGKGAIFTIIVGNEGDNK